MKKIMFAAITVIYLIFNFGTSLYAEDITVTEHDALDSFEVMDFLPDNVKSTLDNANIDVNDLSTSKNVLGFAVNGFKVILSDFGKNYTVLFLVLIFSSLLFKFIDNKSSKVIISYIITLIILLNVFAILKNVLYSALNTLTSVREILSAVLPSFTAVLLLGGSTFTSLTETASFGIILTLLNTILNTLLLPAFTFLMLLTVFERISPQLSDMNLVKFLKKNIITTLSFVTMILLTVISYQHIVSAGRDSVSGRTVKFAAAQFIPIIGAAFGESLRTVGAGLKYLKTTVGGAVMISLLVTVLPCILQIVSAKLCLNFLSFSAGMTDCKSEQGIFDTSVSLLDLLNAIIICITVLSFLLVILFVLSVFPISS